MGPGKTPGQSVTIQTHSAVADPGFPVGVGVHPLGGAWTSDMGTFR